MDSSLAVEATNLSKKYRLGTIGISSLRDDLGRWWRRKKQNSQNKGLLINDAIERSRMINESEFWALHDLNFQITRGEVVGLIGANGSGKSTLLKILSRITEPSEGEVKIRGKVASLLEVGTGFHPELTGRENIYINGAILGMSRREVNSKIEEIIEFAGVSDFIDTPIKRYSSGMTVRLGFAVAVHLNSEVLIVDEVLAVGDANFQKSCIKKMNQIAENEGRTVIFVSHNMAMIENLCTRAIFLDKGNLKKAGETSQVISHYLESTHKSSGKISEDVRGGTGSMRFSAYKLLDEEGRKLGIIKAGIGFRLQLKFEVNENYKPIDPLIILKLKSSTDIPLFVQHNLLHNYHLKNLSKENLIECSLKEFPFPAGVYYLDLRIIDSGEVLDELENVTEINVEQSDYFESGEIPDSKFGLAMVRADWQINK
jgi:lipopolysaccharide transport system ATP-binding protein